MNDILHTPQEHGSTPLCISWCVEKLFFFKVNALLHASQQYGRSPLCKRLCDIRLLFWVNALLHTSQQYGPSPPSKFVFYKVTLSPRSCPYFHVVVGLARSHDPESYTGGSLLLVGSPMPDRSKVMTQTKRDTLVLQVWGNGSREVLPSGTDLSQGVASLPLRATGPPGPGGSTC